MLWGTRYLPWIKDQHEWFLDISKALLVVILIGLLVEIPSWAGYFEQRFMDILRGDLLERLDRTALKDLRERVDASLYRLSDPELAAAFLRMLDNDVYPSLEAPITRDFELHRTVRPCPEIASGLCETELKVLFTRIAPAGSRGTYEHKPVKTVLRAIPGIDKERLYRDAALKFDGTEAAEYSVQFTISADGGLVTVESPAIARDFDKELRVETKSTRLVPAGDVHIYRMNYVVRTVRVFFHYPQGWRAELRFLGVGEFFNQAAYIHDQRDGYIYGVFDGWMLPGHGIVLHCHEPTNIQTVDTQP